MFERFTERARQVVVLAQEESRVMRHDFVGSEHILLGLQREEVGIAGRALYLLGVTVEEVRAQVIRIVGRGEGPTPGQTPFTPRAKKVLTNAMGEAVALGHSYIGTEHLLLGLVYENEGVAARILANLDVDAEKVRAVVGQMLAVRGNVIGQTQPRTGVASDGKIIVVTGNAGSGKSTLARRLAREAGHERVAIFDEWRPDIVGLRVLGDLREDGYTVIVVVPLCKPRLGEKVGIDSIHGSSLITRMADRVVCCVPSTPPGLYEVWKDRDDGALVGARGGVMDVESVWRDRYGQLADAIRRETTSLPMVRARIMASVQP